MSSRSWIRFAVVSCVVLAAALLAAPARADGTCMALEGSIAAHYEMAGSQGPGWYGRSYLTLGKDPTNYAATLVDLNNGSKDHPFRVFPDGSATFAGFELLTFTLDGGGSFLLDAGFICVGGTPGFCAFSEQGKIVPEAGTGQFAGMKGNASIHGSGVFVGAEPTATDPWLWTAKINGTLCKQS